jgi:hypothetical protein
MRWIFTDGFNSVVHFVIGALSYKFPILIPAFILYQLLIHADQNTIIDLSEFAIGYIVVHTIKQNSSLNRA